jgi:hypothetical protein
VSTSPTLNDIRLAWDAHDPELVSLIVTLAGQLDEPADTPVREGAPTFQRFLAELRSPSFRRKPQEEQAHFRIEQTRALEAPDAEAPLPDRLRLHAIVLTLWRDDSVFARTCLMQVISRIPFVYGPWRALKGIFKEAEVKGDTEVYGALAARFDMAFASSHGVSSATLAYLVRRAWRFLRRTGVGLPVAYADTAADVLAAYSEHTLWERTWVANHIFYHQTHQYNRRRFHLSPRPKSLLKDRAFAELWKRSPRPLFGLLERAQSDQVRQFATEALQTDFRAALRDVEPAWVARLVGVCSRVIDDFVVWILTNVPRFEQGAFRKLGLHNAVLRLLDSPSPQAQAYAANYARTHARDLPVAELVRLVDSTSDAVRKLAVDLLQSRDPRTEIGLDAWGWLLETKYGHKLAAAALRQHFGPRELTPQWFNDRLLSPSAQAAEFAQKLLPDVHPTQQLGPGFFGGLLDALSDRDAKPVDHVAEFALAELARFEVNLLDPGLLQRLLLNPLTRPTIFAWVHGGQLKAATYPLDFLKALAFPPAWASHPAIVELRQSDRAWAQALEFNEELADQVLAWLGDVRQFAPAALAFDWLMQLVESSEPRYHDFAVETMIKGFTPADFAPRQETVALPSQAAPQAVSLGNASFLFTGKMATMPRKDAESAVTQAGGVVAAGVTKKLHYLVIGDEGSPLYSGGRKGDKQTKAEDLNTAGANIRIISETAFQQMLAGAPQAASADATRLGCERLWQMAVAPGTAEARRGEFARKYILRHHPDIGPALTDRPVDPGTEVPPDFLAFARVEPLFAESRKPLRDFAQELARWEFARWKPSAEALLALSELPHAEVRKFVAEALLADDAPDKRRFRINPDTLAPEGLYRFCESPDAGTRRLGMEIIQHSARLRVPEELFRLTESPDRLVRGFVIRSLWALYRERGGTPDWKPSVPPAPSLGAAARKAAAQPEPRGPGMPHRPDKLPAGPANLAAFLRRILFEIPPGRTESGLTEPASTTARLKPLPARRAKLELVEVMRDVALEDADFAAGVLSLLEEFMTSRGRSERAACLVAVTRIRHKFPGLPGPTGEAG